MGGEVFGRHHVPHAEGEFETWDDAFGKIFAFRKRPKKLEAVLACSKSMNAS